MEININEMVSAVKALMFVSKATEHFNKAFSAIAFTMADQLLDEISKNNNCGYNDDCSCSSPEQELNDETKAIRDDIMNRINSIND